MDHRDHSFDSSADGSSAALDTLGGPWNPAAAAAPGEEGYTARHHSDQQQAEEPQGSMDSTTTGSSSSNAGMQSTLSVDGYADVAGPSSRSSDTTFRVGQFRQSACPICLERYTLDNPAMLLPCRHAFHLQCLEGWWQRSRLCPVCMKPVNRRAVRPMAEADMTLRGKAQAEKRSTRRAAAATGGPAEGAVGSQRDGAAAAAASNAEDEEFDDNEWVEGMPLLGGAAAARRRHAPLPLAPLQREGDADETSSTSVTEQQQQQQQQQRPQRGPAAPSLANGQGSRGVLSSSSSVDAIDLSTAPRRASQLGHPSERGPSRRSGCSDDGVGGKTHQCQKKAPEPQPPASSSSSASVDPMAEGDGSSAAIQPRHWKLLAVTRKVAGWCCCD